MPDDRLPAPGGAGAGASRGRTGAEGGQLTTIRTRVIGLPLQTSTFDQLATAPEVLEAPGTPYRAALDDAGSLAVEGVDALAETMARELDTTRAHAIRREVSRRVAHLDELIGTAGRGDAAEEIEEAVTAIGRLVPLALIGQPIGNALWGWLVRAGFTGEPPAPHPSVGAVLVRDLESLAEWCREHGHDVADVASGWPDVPPEVAREIRAFADSHAGYGPLAWEAPGYDDPARVADTLARTTGNVPASVVRPQSPAAHRDDAIGAVLSLLAAWLQMTERGIWLVRTAFFAVILPRLPEVAARNGMTAADVLFLRVSELAGGVDQQALGSRRAAYDADAEYHRKNGTGPGRPEALVAAGIETTR